REGRGLPPAVGAVELGAVDQGSAVVHGDDVGRGGLRALALPQHLVLEAARGGLHALLRGVGLEEGLRGGAALLPPRALLRLLRRHRALPHLREQLALLLLGDASVLAGERVLHARDERVGVERDVLALVVAAELPADGVVDLRVVARERRRARRTALVAGEERRDREPGERNRGGARGGSSWAPESSGARARG